MRWQHPTRGVIAPDVFIPIAEADGLIVPIGRWVLNQACAQAAAWRRRGYALDISVNVSARQLEHDDLVDEVRDALAPQWPRPGDADPRDHRNGPHAQTGSHREAAARAEGAWGTHRGRRLRDRYSSLAFLRRFPVDSLKIDRSFIRGLEVATDTNAQFPPDALKDPTFIHSLALANEAQTLTHTLIQLGKALGLRTLAEGVEQSSQVRQLQHEGCDLAQGFLFAQPLAPDAVETFLDERAADGARSVELLTGR